MLNSSGMTQICMRRLQREYKEIIKEPIENIKIYVCPTNMLLWYYCITDLDDHRYECGEYYGLIEMSPDYPLEPPSYYMYTPSGRFVPGERICTTNSDFHLYEWKPTWTMETLFRAFLSVFLEDNSTGQIFHNHVRTTTSEKRDYAHRSKEYNKKYHSELYDIFDSNEGVIYKPPVYKPPISAAQPKEESKPDDSQIGKIKIKLKLKSFIQSS
jgi:ubiquitin-conjugating enzyme E2 J2